MLCLHYTLCLMQLSVVRNLILMGCLDDIPVSGLLVIDAVGWRSMYFVVIVGDITPGIPKYPCLYD
jgi:hypothetical protein